MSKTNGWVVVGTYEAEGRWVSEVLAEGFADETEARQARSQMARNLGDEEIGLDVQTAQWAARWCQ